MESQAARPGGAAVVVGGGPGGYAAALGLAREGWSVRLIEAREVGGTCMHRGCIPTKTLLESGRVAADLRRAAEFGLAAAEPAVDWDAVRARQDRVVATLAGGLASLLRGAGVTVERGWAALRPQAEGGRPVVRVTPATDGAASAAPVDLSADAVVLAPGAVPVQPAVPGLDLPGVLDSDGLLARAERPRRLCIIGGGAIGCEFATAHADLGAEVAIVEALPQLLPRAEPDIARRLQAAMRRRGITAWTGCRLLGIAPGPVVRVADAAGAQWDWPADAVLVAVGRRPATSGLGLEEGGVALGADGTIVVDECMRTSAPGVWAVGDALGGPMVAHRAFHQAATMVAAICGRPPAGVPPVPQPVFCRPEVAWVGETEAEARARGAEVRVARVPYGALGRAHAAGDVEGLCKVVADGSGRVLGVHLIGAHATELIGAACVALGAGAGAEDLARAVLPHPTLVEGLTEAAALLAGHPLHVPPGR